VARVVAAVAMIVAANEKAYASMRNLECFRFINLFFLTFKNVQPLEVFIESEAPPIRSRKLYHAHLYYAA